MRLKTRLTIAFFIIILVPVLMAGLAFVGFGNYQMRSIEESYDIDEVTYETLSNSLQIVSKFTQSIFEEMRGDANGNADVFLDTEYLAGLNDRLRERYSYLIVRREGVLYYSGSNGNITKLFREVTGTLRSCFGNFRDMGITLRHRIAACISGGT